MALFASRRSRRLLSRLAAAGVAVACVAMLNASSAETLEDTLPEDPRFPGQGLPGYGQHPTTEQSTWIDPQATTLNYMGVAKQWVRPPTLYTVGSNLPTATLNDPRCSGRLGEGVRNRRDYRAPLVFLNPHAAPTASNRFGETQSFTVRTAAFGSLPVEAVVTLEQPRNVEGAVLPAIATQRGVYYCVGEGPFESGNGLLGTTVTGTVSVRVTRLRVDGVPISLASRCIAADGRLSLSAPDYFDGDPQIRDEERPPQSSEDIAGILRTKFFNIGNGGLLSGTLDIPAFSGCRTTKGDDLSRILTAAVAGEGNPVTVRSEGLPPLDGLNPSTDPKTQPCPWTGNCEARLPALDIPESAPAP